MSPRSSTLGTCTSSSDLHEPYRIVPHRTVPSNGDDDDSRLYTSNTSRRPSTLRSTTRSPLLSSPFRSQLPCLVHRRVIARAPSSTMAAAEVLVLSESWTGSEYGWPSTRRWTTGWDERSLRVQMGTIARAWVAERFNKPVSEFGLQLDSHLQISLVLRILRPPNDLGPLPFSSLDSSKPNRPKLYPHLTDCPSIGGP